MNLPHSIILICVWYLLGTVVFGWCAYLKGALRQRFNFTASNVLGVAFLITIYPITAAVVTYLIARPDDARRVARGVR